MAGGGRRLSQERLSPPGGSTPARGRPTVRSRRPHRRRARRRGRPATAPPAWSVAPSTVMPRARRPAHSSTSVVGIECTGDVVGEKQFRLDRQCPGERQPLNLSAGEPDSAVTDERVDPARRGDVGGRGAHRRRPARSRGRDRGARCRRTSPTAPGAPARRARPARAAGTSGHRRRRRRSNGSRRCGRPARTAPTAGWTFPIRPGPSSSTSSPASTVRSTPVTPRVPSSCTAVTSRSSKRCSGVRDGGCGSGAVPATTSTPGGMSIRSAPPAKRLVASCHARVPGASVTTAPATLPK